MEVYIDRGLARCLWASGMGPASLPLNPGYGLREYSVSSSENESLSRPSERHSEVFLTHLLTVGAYQTTKTQF